jgi:sugar phosphate permease
VLIGELAGNGLLVSSGLAAAFSWRVSLAWPALPALVVAWLVLRLREPERGGQLTGAGSWDRARGDARAQGPEASADARRVPLREALGYVLKTRTAVILIISSVLGYFFLAGVAHFRNHLRRTALSDGCRS